jgi:tetratricopeptide (TPR) repeat protein
MRPVALPDLSRMSESVRQQIRDGHASLMQKIENGATSAADRANAYGEMGGLFMAAQYLDQAEGCYLNAHALAPEDARWPYYLAHVYRSKSDPAKAAAFFERSLELQPTDLATLVYLGDEYLSLGRAEAAEAPLAKALSLEPRLAVAHFGLGRAALAQKDHARAVEHLEKALAFEPRASTARYPLAMAYRSLGQLGRAEAHLRERGDVRFEYLPDPLMLKVQQLLASAEAYEFRGSAALDQGEFSAAAFYLKNGVEQAPINPSVRLKLAEALRRGGLARESLEHYERAVALATGAAAAPARFGHAMAFVRLGRYEDARDRLNEGMTAHPEYAAFGQALARILAAAPDEGVRDGRRALALTRALLERRQTPDLYVTMAMALAEVGEFQEAARLQRELIAAARRAGNADFAQAMEENLRLYEARKPCRAPWTEVDMP